MMETETKNRRKKRIIHLTLLFTFITIVFGSATYAWFIGLRTVSVNPFEIEIATTKSLDLSLDGVHWSDTVTINKDNYSDPGTPGTYSTNTNNWAGRGLIPVSTVGEIDTSSNRMKLYEKGSLTATAGGYRLMASRVPNYTAGSAPDGYVVFDLFIRNSSGTEYYSAYNILNEEAIYLTVDSKVKVGSTGVADAGIENSVRVAFAQIGRVQAPTTTDTEGDDIAKIQGITCNNGIGVLSNGVTSICRTATIWEPNDTDHVADALTWYNTTCMERTGDNTALASSYNVDTPSTCQKVVNGQAYNTYAIGKEILVMNGVDVYDGDDYNTYTTDVADTYADVIAVPGANESNNGKYLYPVPYFTDTMKLKRGTERPTFMTLAPNSVTKIRVYIYLEGQDIDNYDFASIGKQISVKFGFTKERFTEDDINYSGPVLNQGEGPNMTRAEILADAGLTEQSDAEDIIAAIKLYDKTAPVIHFPDNTEQNVTIDVGDSFTAPTVSSVTDNVSSINKSAVVQSGVVNNQVPGVYRILYEVVDEAGNLATEVVTVTVRGTATPTPTPPAELGGGD